MARTGSGMSKSQGRPPHAAQGLILDISLFPPAIFEPTHETIQ